MAFIQTTGWSFLNTFTAVSWLLAKQTSLVHAVLQLFFFFSFEFRRRNFINYNHLISMKHNVACYMFIARWRSEMFPSCSLNQPLRIQARIVVCRSFAIAWSNEAQISSVFGASKRRTISSGFSCCWKIIMGVEWFFLFWTAKKTEEFFTSITRDDQIHSKSNVLFFFSKWWEMFTLK